MRTHNVEFHAELRNYGRHIDLHVMIRGSIDVPDKLAKPIVFEVPEDDAALPEPAISFPLRAAQSLMDQLWHCGLRPSEGSGSAGALAATQAHLADMRDIAQQALEVVLGRSE